MQRKMSASCRARRVIGTIFFGMTMAAAGQAVAGDLARSEVIGFSPDGRYVAFEEYGAQDASGSPYASIYVIDVAANAWVAGAPVQVMLGYDVLPEPWSIDNAIARARTRAMSEAQPLLDAHGIVAGETGTTLIHHPLSDLNVPDHEMAFSIGLGYSPDGHDQHTMALTERQVEYAECDRHELGPVAVMDLELRVRNGAWLTLQSDAEMPSSRGCAMGYRIHDIIVYAPNQPDQSACCHRDLSMLVLIAVEVLGYGGPSWRFMAVTAELNGAW